MEYTVALTKIINNFALETVYLPEDIEQRLVKCADINHPGLALSGYSDLFDKDRIQLIGFTEHKYLTDLGEEKRDEAFERLCALDPCCIIFTSDLPIPEKLVKIASSHKVPLCRTESRTSYFSYALVAYLNVELAQRITRHGVLVEVYGEGVLILGDSGVGKSETAIELIKRGHRLIADDAVEIKKVSSKALVGSAPDIIKHMVELRGIGLVDVSRIFGMGAIKETEKIDLIVNFEPWEKGKFYDRIGLETDYMEILGIKLPSLTIPVRPGRNLAVILEIAAMIFRQKRLGYNAAEEFNKRLEEQMKKNSEDFLAEGKENI